MIKTRVKVDLEVRLGGGSTRVVGIGLAFRVNKLARHEGNGRVIMIVTVAYYTWNIRVAQGLLKESIRLSLYKQISPLPCGTTLYHSHTLNYILNIETYCLAFPYLDFMYFHH